MKEVEWQGMHAGYRVQLFVEGGRLKAALPNGQLRVAYQTEDGELIWATPDSGLNIWPDPEELLRQYPQATSRPPDRSLAGALERCRRLIGL